MKRILILTAWLVGAPGWVAPSVAQDTTAAVAAAREEAEANFKRINSKIEQLEEAFQAHSKRMNAVLDEVHSLRNEMDKLKSRNESAATQESIKRLADKIEEVDKKRQADNELVLAQLKAISKGLSKPIQPKEQVAPPPANPKPEAPASPNGTAPSESGYTYKIKAGDNPSRIVKDLSAVGVKITLKQLMEANPNVTDWTKLKIGQSIFIPQAAP